MCTEVVGVESTAGEVRTLLIGDDSLTEGLHTKA